MRHCLTVVLIAVATACAGIGYQTQGLRDAVIGVSASDLQSCLGQPLDVHIADASELWVYRRTVAGGSREISIQLAEGIGTSHKRPDVLEGSPEDHTRDDTRNLTPTGDSVPAGVCRLAFQLVDGTVRAVDATGRTRENMNANDECAIHLEPCGRPLP